MLKITIILLAALGLRLFGIAWDKGIHLHPDERMLMIVAERLHFFDKLNPDFFNYGSLPIYILRGVAQFLDIFGLNLGNYNGMLYVGRFLSAAGDIATAYFIYLVARLLFKEKKIALLSAFFYALAFFPIQNGHFFIVDTFLALFATVLLYVLLLYIKKPHWKKIVWMAAALAAAVTSKFTAVVFAPVVVGVVTYQNFKQKNNQIVQHLIVLGVAFLLFSFFFMPYAYLNWEKFSADVLLQIKLNSDAYIFPYTLQYVGTLPYLYYLQNIFWWGLGPFISLLSAAGIYFLFKNHRRALPVVFVLIFYLFYFVTIGRSAVKFMRYMLPLYPFFALLAGYGAYALSRPKKGRRSMRFLVMGVMALAVFWSLMFVNIYTREHPRITASDWINKNVPEGSTLAVEHWDDSLPLYGGERYNFVELTLYDLPDDQRKWNLMNEKLGRADYVILSSNRLYVPLQKLSDCSLYKSCYPLAAQYYQRLFGGQSEFKKIAEFVVYPGFQLTNWSLTIPDDAADESFTVYDHPKVIIFRRESREIF